MRKFVREFVGEIKVFNVVFSGDDEHKEKLFTYIYKGDILCDAYLQSSVIAVKIILVKCVQVK